MADPAGIRLPGSGVFEVENLPAARDFLRERGLAYVRNRRRGKLGKKWGRIGDFEAENGADDRS